MAWLVNFIGNLPTEKLIKLLKPAGKPWSHQKELHNETPKVSENCNNCKSYKKRPPRQIVGIGLALPFQECVNLKFYKGNILLHLIDHTTRLSISTVILSKSPDMIFQAILVNWVSVYCAADKFLSDNGGGFANESFLELCASLNITAITTGAEAL